MKYRVSLLPEKNRKRILGRKKAEKGRGIANIAILLILGVLLITLVSKLVADAKLSEIQAKNAEYEQKVQALQQFRQINDTLQAKVQLIEAIQVNEPSLYNFMASFGNVSKPGVSVTEINCTEWKTSRICNVQGTAISRDAFNAYLDALKNLDGVKSADCTSYMVSVVDGEASATFTITITCDGGAAPVVVATQPVETTAAAE